MQLSVVIVMLLSVRMDFDHFVNISHSELVLLTICWSSLGGQHLRTGCNVPINFNHELTQ